MSLLRINDSSTANSLSTIQRPLLDRMEIIEIAGYTLEEKVEIAKRHLIKKQQEENGLDAKSFKLGNTELKHIIDAHSSESGAGRCDVPRLHRAPRKTRARRLHPRPPRILVTRIGSDARRPHPAP